MLGQLGRLSDAAFHQIPDPGHWRGQKVTAARGHLSLLRLGDCSWLEIDHAHTLGSVGYPRYLAEILATQGVALGFFNWHAGMSILPDRERLGSLVGETRPDAVLLQFGVGHALREILPLQRMNCADLRLWVNWRLGRAGGPIHRRLVGPFARRFGRAMLPSAAKSDAPTRFAQWLGSVRAAMPNALLAYMPPYPAVRDGWIDPGLLEEAARLLTAAAHREGVTVIDPRADLRRAAALRGGDLYGANGYDLRRDGHVLVARHLERWLASAAPLPQPVPPVMSSGSSSI